MLKITLEKKNYAKVEVEFKRQNIYLLQHTLVEKNNILNAISSLKGTKYINVIFDNQYVDYQDDLEKFRRRNVRIIEKNAQLIDYLTPAQYVKIALELDVKQHHVDYPYIIDALKKMGISQKMAHEKINRLVESQRYRVALAGALTVKAPIIIIDDITGNLGLNELTKLLAILRWLAVELDKIIIINSDDKRILKIDPKIVNLV